MPNGQFKRGFDYPNEGFIQAEFFESQGFKLLNEKYTDLICIHSEVHEKRGCIQPLEVIFVVVSYS